MTVLGRASSILVLGTIRMNTFCALCCSYHYFCIRSSFKSIVRFAQVAELVDALVSGTSVRKYVKVRVLSWAQKEEVVSNETASFLLVKVAEPRRRYDDELMTCLYPMLRILLIDVSLLGV